eukprot:SAG31_NODE_1793_length_7241_cov_2.075611_5_plen_225_part_00
MPRSAGGAEKLPLLTAAFPQYKPAALLFALRWFDGDAAATHLALLTSSDTHFWRLFHSCGAGLTAPCGRINRARLRSNRPATAPSTGAAAASMKQSQKAFTAESFAEEVSDEILREVLAFHGTGPRRQLQPDGKIAAADVEAIMKQRVRPASASRVRSANPDGLGTALELAEIAKGLVAEGNMADAIPLLERCSKIFGSKLPPDSNYSQITAQRLAEAKLAVAC